MLLSLAITWPDVGMALVGALTFLAFMWLMLRGQ